MQKWMKEFFVPIDKAGRVVLPKNVREELAIRPGDLLKVSTRGNEVTLRPQKNIAGLVRRGKALVFSGGESNFLARETVETILAEGREAPLTQLP